MWARKSDACPRPLLGRGKPRCLITVLRILAEGRGSALGRALAHLTPLSCVVLPHYQAAGLDQKILLLESHGSETQQKRGDTDIANKISSSVYPV